MKKLVLLVLLLCACTFEHAAAQNTFFAGNPGDMIYRGTTAWQRVPGGTAGQVLQSNGPTAAPTWSNGFGTYTTFPFVLPTIATNRALMNVTGGNATPTAGDVSQFLDTIGYDIQRPPLVGSTIFKDPVTSKWQALQPGPAGFALLSGGPGAAPAWAFITSGAVPGAAGTVLTSNGVGVAPTYQAIPGGFTGFANPTGTIGLTAVNGGLTTALRSDAAPALSQAIVPTWTGLHTYAAGLVVNNTFATNFKNGSGNSGNAIGMLAGDNLSVGDANFGNSLRLRWGGQITFETGLAGANSVKATLLPSGCFGLGTATDCGAPGIMNVLTGFRIGNAATSANYLRGNGANFVSSAIQQGDLPETSQRGYAVMYPYSDQASRPNTGPGSQWIVRDPYGNAITCTDATTTQCLQEFLTATTTNGWPARVYCKGTTFPSGLEPVVIEATTTVTVPVAQDWDFRADATCNLNFNVTTVPGLVIDSKGASNFDWAGKIRYEVASPNFNTNVNPSCAVVLKPTTATQDGFSAIYASRIRIATPSGPSGPPSGTGGTSTICIDLAAGSVSQNQLEFGETNSGGLKNFFIYNATVSAGPPPIDSYFAANNIVITEPHGGSEKLIDIGFNSTLQSHYRDNIWTIANIQPLGASAVAISTYGSNDQFTIGRITSDDGNPFANGIVTQSGANNNTFRWGSITPISGAAYIDNGTCNAFYGEQGSQAVLFGTTSGCAKLVTPAAAGSTIITMPIGTRTLATLNGSETLSNKVLQSPEVSGTLALDGSSSGLVLLQATAATTGTRAITFPDANGTVSLTGSSVASFSAGTTGLTPSTATTGVVTLAGTLVLANGGTSKALTASNGGIVYTDADSMEVLAGTATAGQIIRSGANSAPSWSTATYPNTVTQYGILYAPNANEVGTIGSIPTGALITAAGSVPAWTPGVTPNRVLRTTGSVISFDQVVLSTDISGFGTGVASALGTAVGSAGAPVLFNGALGTPTSGTVTNLTGTASININGTVGATTPTTGAFTTVTASSTITATAPNGTAIAQKLNGRASDDLLLLSFYKNDGTTRVGYVSAAAAQFTFASDAGVISYTTAGGEQFRVTDTASASRYVTATGSNGGNPTVSVSGGGLSLPSTIFMSGLSADTATTDTSVCRITATSQIATGTGALGVCLGTSGRQFKTAFSPMSEGLNEIMQISMQNYRYVEGHGDNGERLQYGPTAQDVEKAIPSLARRDDHGNTINYDWTGLLFVGLHAIQELKANNDNLRAELEQLKRRMAR